MSRNYKMNNPEGIYFLSFSVDEWVDVFSRRAKEDINKFHPLGNKTAVKYVIFMIQ